jgi:hypothetical protein
MRFIHIIMFFDFMQVLLIKRRHPTNNEYFPIHILFTIIYLLQEQRLIPRNYSKQELIMEIFLVGPDQDMNIHAKIKSISKYVYL